MRLLAVLLVGTSVVSAYDCSSLSSWASASVYTGGLKVQHDGKAYEAKWWTQGKNPADNSGVDDEWKLLGTCAAVTPPSVPVPPTTTPTPPSVPTPPSGQCSGQQYSAGTMYALGALVYNSNQQYECIVAGWCSNGAAAAWYEPGVGTAWTDAWTAKGACGSNNGPPTAPPTTPTTPTPITPPTTPSTETPPSTPPTSGDSMLIGYFVEWGIYGRNYHIKNIADSGSAKRLTHIVYSFGNVLNAACTIGDTYAAYDKAYSAADSVDGVADTWDTGALRGNFGQLRRLKKLYPNIKVVWSFGGWTWSGGFGAATAQATSFADSCYKLVYDSRWSDVFDGIDIDWEYPNDCGLSCDTSGFSGYKTLMKALRDRFGKDKLVVAAIGAGESKLKAADYGGAAQYVDFYNVMTYDYFGGFSPTGPTAPHSPLNDYDGIPTAGFYSDKAVQVMKDLKIPASKINLGIGFYGRGWTGVTQSAPGGSATKAATGTYEAGIEDYKVLKTSCPATGTIGGTAYAYCNGNWWGYDTPSTIAGKMTYAKQQGLGGAFFWELSGDTTTGELINAIGNGLD
eukprot:gene9302-14412_t